MDTAGEKQLKELLGLIERHLPGWAGFVEAEYRGNRDFQTLCGDYLVCAIAKEKWEQNQSPIAYERRREYAEWHDELLQDIKDWLQRPRNSSKAS